MNRHEKEGRQKKTTTQCLGRRVEATMAANYEIWRIFGRFGGKIRCEQVQSALLIRRVNELAH